MEKAQQEKKKDKKQDEEEEEKKEEEGVAKRKPQKMYKVTSLGEKDCSFCLKVIGSDISVSSPYLPSVVE